jgi:hypothetical protein
MEFVVVDVETGRVYDPPFDSVSFHFPPSEEFDVKGRWASAGNYLSHKQSSRLLMIEGCLNREVNAKCGRTFFVIGAGGLKEVYFDPDRLSDGSIAP